MRKNSLIFYKDKEQCFIMYKCNFSKAEKCMKNLTGNCKNQFK